MTAVKQMALSVVGFFVALWVGLPIMAFVPGVALTTAAFITVIAGVVAACTFFCFGYRRWAVEREIAKREERNR